MSEKWVHSMEGVPWTSKKMKEAVEILRRNATISFSFDSDKLTDLVKLDELVLSKRPDLILHIWSYRDRGDYSNELIDTLAGLKNVTALHLDVAQKQDLSRLQALKSLEYLQLDTDKPISIDFISNFQKLEDLCLTGKFEDLSPVGKCKNLSSLALKCTVKQLDFVKEIPLKNLLIDNCRVNCSLDVINIRTLKVLDLSSIIGLEDVSFLSEFRHLEVLGLSLSRVEKLFDFSNMENLKSLELNYMKSLKEIDPIKTAPNLEELELQEINTKIKAEEFDFLSDMPKLKKLDFRFIDFNKKRIEAIRNKLIAAGKQDILIK